MVVCDCVGILSSYEPGMRRVGIELGTSRLIASYLFHCAIMAQAWDSRLHLLVLRSTAAAAAYRDFQSCDLPSTFDILLLEADNF